MINFENDDRKLMEYLKKIKNSSKPFNCGDLIILPEEINWRGHAYKKNHLVCKGILKAYGTMFDCQVGLSPLTWNDAGNLEFKCGFFGAGKFEVSLIEFKYKK
jgi:hypothetical protein